MELCKKDIKCYKCMCYGSYNTGGRLYCKCGKYKKEEV